MLTAVTAPLEGMHHHHVTQSSHSINAGGDAEAAPAEDAGMETTGAGAASEQAAEGVLMAGAEDAGQDAAAELPGAAPEAAADSTDSSDERQLGCDGEV
jgi:hypothetical protein